MEKLYHAVRDKNGSRTIVCEGCALDGLTATWESGVVIRCPRCGGVALSVEAPRYTDAELTQALREHTEHMQHCHRVDETEAEREARERQERFDGQWEWLEAIRKR